MPEYLAPGVYLEEVSFRSKSIEGVSTTTTGFIGPVRYGPIQLEPDIITSLSEFERTYSGAELLVFADQGRMDNYVWHGVRAFFEQGGKRLYVARTFKTLPYKVNGNDQFTYIAPSTDILADWAAEKIKEDYVDGHGRVWLSDPGTSAENNAPPKGSWLIRARYPGDYGNLRVQLTLSAGPNWLGGVPDAAQPGGYRAVLNSGDLVENDLLLVTRRLRATSDKYDLCLAQLDPETRNWQFQSLEDHGEHGVTKLSDLDGNPATNSGDSVRKITLSVAAFDDYRRNIGVWSDLSPNPVRLKNGRVSSVFTDFGSNGEASAAANVQLLPIELKTAEVDPALPAGTDLALLLNIWPEIRRLTSTEMAVSVFYRDQNKNAKSLVLTWNKEQKLWVSSVPGVFEIDPATAQATLMDSVAAPKSEIGIIVTTAEGEESVKVIIPDPPQPKLTAKDDGSVDIEPPQSKPGDKFVINYTTSTNQAVTANLIKNPDGDAADWKLDPLDPNLNLKDNTGITTLAADKMAVGSAVTVTSPSGGSATVKAADLTIPKLMANDDGSIEIEPPQSKPGDEFVINYKASTNKEMTVKLIRNADGGAADWKLDPLDPNLDFKADTGITTLTADKIAVGSAVKVTSHSGGSTTVKAIDPTIPKLMAKDDGSIEIEPPQSKPGDKFVINYTTSTNRAVTANLIKNPDGDAVKWKLDPLDPNLDLKDNTGITTLAADKMAVGSAVTVTSPSGGSATVKAADVFTPIIIAKPDGSVTVEVAASSPVKQMRVDYVAANGVAQKAGLSKGANSKWSSDNADLVISDADTGEASLAADRLTPASEVRVTVATGTRGVSAQTQVLNGMQPQITVTEGGKVQINLPKLPDANIEQANRVQNWRRVIARLGTGITLECVLAGGNDGNRPGGAEYEGADDPHTRFTTGLKAFEGLEDISIVAAPGHTWNYDVGLWRDEANTVIQLLISHAERMRYCIAVLDSAQGHSIASVRKMRAKIDSKYAALYYPWVRVLDPVTRREISLPPSGFVAGIYARNDINRAVYKAPANEVVTLALGFETMLNKAQQEVLNPEGINCFRFFEGRGMLLWGARTISSDPEWKYVNLRRYFAYVERSIDKGTQWAVFEPNGPALWRNVRYTITDFLMNEWSMGALLGDKPEQAFFVRCDWSTMTQNDIDNGRMVCQIGMRVVKPAEFVIFRIGQFTADRKGG